MRVIDAARLMDKGYNRDNFRGRMIDALDASNGVQAWYLNDRTLIIPGTNDPNDWLRNLNLIARPSTFLADTLGRGASGAKWHGGFLDHARQVYNWIKDRGLRPRHIIGHSLGAAAAQIVGASLKVPTISFGTPRPKYGTSHFPGEGFVLNICREDDRICDVPPKFLKFRNIGSVYDIRPPTFRPGNDHRMPFYIHLLANPATSGNVPRSWPPL